MADSATAELVPLVRVTIRAQRRVEAGRMVTWLTEAARAGRYW